jgi:phosphoribosyl 1,2-cyclic phosphodiesterase
MRVKFYGTRGSIPVPEKNFMEFGGNTPCVLVTFDNGVQVILDAGSGIRKLGKEILGKPLTQQRVYILLSHTHWDHIQGLPFFAPAFEPHFPLTIFLNQRHNLAAKLPEIIANQMRHEYFPVDFKAIHADIEFREYDQEAITTSWGSTFEMIPLNHPGKSYGYRLEYQGKTTVYCTDVEHKADLDPRIVHLARHADLLIHDAQYTPEELETHKGWGHSSWKQAVELAQLAGVKRLALFHHDPDHDDDFLLGIEKQAQEVFKQAFVAREGMELKW